jgi:hypothetical protein
VKKNAESMPMNIPSAGIARMRAPAAQRDAMRSLVEFVGFIFKEARFVKAHRQYKSCQKARKQA